MTNTITAQTLADAIESANLRRYYSRRQFAAVVRRAMAEADAMARLESALRIAS